LFLSAFILRQKKNEKKNENNTCKNGAENFFTLVLFGKKMTILKKDQILIWSYANSEWRQ
jgi:hypothetical protein